MAMNRRERRRKRERESMPPALSALLDRVTPHNDTSASLRYLKTFATPLTVESGGEGEGEEPAYILEGEGLDKLCKELGKEISSTDVLAIAHRVPRSQSTLEKIVVADLCFALAQAIAPINVHERRRNVGNTAPLDENAPMLKYYGKDRFVHLLECAKPADTKSEWQAFFECVSSPLPMTLRVHRNEPALKHIADSFLLHDPMLSKVVKPVTPLLPPSAGLYGCSHADYHAEPRVEFICRTLHGGSAVSFQETVSLLPVLVADIKPHHAVLDMCAAPGSKTLQILDDMLQYGWSTSSVSQGVVIVNEKDRVKATQMLPSRLKRFHAPNAICIRCDGSQWPRLFSPSPPSLESKTAFTEKRFDRIICDVPCSGDGTIRKDPATASSWTPGYVKSLLPTQKALLRRGLDLLEEGGILVYSTCSMNPKEDEEVVCAGLELFGDTVELLDVNAILKEKGATLHSFGGVLSCNVDHLQRGVLPPTFDGRKVLRVLPHRDNTGGFFVATFRKRSLSPDWAPPFGLHAKLNHWTKGKLWSPVDRHDTEWCKILEFYGIDPDCRDIFQYYNRRGEKDGDEKLEAEAATGLVPLYHLNPNGAACRRIVLVTRAVARMLFETRPYKGPGVEIVSVGARAFEAYDGKFLSTAKCRWRAVVESASYLAPFIRGRKIVLDAAGHPELLRELLSTGFLLLEDHWRVILHQSLVVTTTNNNSLSSDVDATDMFSLVRPDGPLHELLRSTEWTEPPAVEMRLMLAENVLIGGVLVGLVGGKLTGGESPWWLSASLSSTKLELAVDTSLRGLGLLAFLGVETSETESSVELLNVE